MQTTPPARWSRNPWFYVAAVLGFLLFICFLAIGSEVEDASSTPPPASSPTLTPTTPPIAASPVPTPTMPLVDARPSSTVANPLVASFTGQELHDCLSDPTTPVERRTVCRNAADLATLEAVLRTSAEFPTQEQRELENAIKQADGLFERIGDVLRDPDGFLAYCGGALAVHLTALQTLQDYQATVDPPLLYLDHRLVAINSFLGDLAATCP